MRVRLVILGCSLFFLFWQIPWCVAENGYLYVNSNTGAASGGHIGFKSGLDVYHYQFFPDERFFLVRDSWDHFRLIYNRLRNRTIVTAELPPEAAARIDQTLREELLSQQLAVQREEQLLQNQSLLEAILSDRGRVSVNGLGFFAGTPLESRGGAYIRDAVQSILGEGVFARSVRAVRGDLAAAFQALEQWRGTPDELHDLLDELAGLIAKQAAVDMLVEARDLSERAVLGPARPVMLSDQQIAGFKAYLDLKIKTIARLVQSPGAETGAPLLLQLARCHALYISVAMAQLFTLDPFPDNSKTKQIDLSVKDSAVFLQKLMELLYDKTDALTELSNQRPGAAGDLWYSLLERSNGKLNEVGSALSSGARVRLATELMVPSRSRAAVIPPVQVSAFLRGNGRQFVSESRRIEAEAIKASYSYNLIHRNCVNELLRTVNSGFKDPAEAQQMLGGSIDPVSDRVVIPHDFFYQVTSSYRTGGTITYPSRRLHGLSERKKEGDDFTLWLREGNTISSSLYRPRPEDSPFLFFTDNLFWARPILGLINLGWGALRSAGGILLLPEDGGDMFLQGFRGMFYSVPELFFCNIRKGTYAYEDFSTRTNEL